MVTNKTPKDFWLNNLNLRSGIEALSFIRIGISAFQFVCTLQTTVIMSCQRNTNKPQVVVEASYQFES
ncbi:hypothetical protein DAPPUDRAFT_264629 [Daphnia pulex]|uniref:Uncharacterized protein n=1 Tax=Daphnia pulex TaxID=6669 RepID=E9HS01_DAPPU|nr:hypothetical protein DAPPUDRAFT_264629 [Daphnia pulex]|eukprot:EFX65473.1 hypothetical protein DAPPUDRAFT_264629 [Daphnia pulex]